MPRMSFRAIGLGVAIGLFLGMTSTLLITSSSSFSQRKHPIELVKTSLSEQLNNIETKFDLPSRTGEVPRVEALQPANKPEPEVRSPRKILLDCGANVASTALLFRETYPEGRDFTIHSFEIDDRLSPYFNPFDNLHLHCPVGVAGKDGNMTAFSEMVWGPNKGKNHGMDMQWGGGSLFVSDQERGNNITGGHRKLSYRKTIPVIDLSRWIMNTFSVDDYIIFKLDVEGAEFEILRKMLDDHAFAYIDKYYGEYHYGQPTGWEKKDKDQIQTDIAKEGHKMISWAGETRSYGDIDQMNPVKVPPSTPGKPGAIYSKCETGSVALAVAVGMNFKRAHRVVATLAAHQHAVPTTLFVYGDFVQAFPEAVRAWGKHFTIGVRGDGHNPPGHLELLPKQWVRMGLISAILRLEEIGLTASYYLPTVTADIPDTITTPAAQRGLRVIKPIVEFPAKNGTADQLTWQNYYRFRDVERVPKALRRIHNALTVSSGGVLSIDTDLPDTYMNSVFLMDYLAETSGFKLVHMDQCIARSQ